MVAKEILPILIFSRAVFIKKIFYIVVFLFSFTYINFWMYLLSMLLYCSSHFHMPLSHCLFLLILINLVCFPGSSSDNCVPAVFREMGSVRDGTLIWLQRREIGHQPRSGQATSLTKNLYSSVQVVSFYSPFSNHSDGQHHGGIFNFDFSTDGYVIYRESYFHLKL